MTDLFVDDFILVITFLHLTKIQY